MLSSAETPLVVRSSTSQRQGCSSPAPRWELRPRPQEAPPPECQQDSSHTPHPLFNSRAPLSTAAPPLLPHSTRSYNSSC
jgi:hypothetical protein